MKSQCLGLLIYFCKVFVDDVSIGAKYPGKGLINDGKALRWSVAKEEEDQNSEDDIRVAELVVDIAQSLQNEGDIQMTLTHGHRTTME